MNKYVRGIAYSLAVVLSTLVAWFTGFTASLFLASFGVPHWAYYVLDALFLVVSFTLSFLAFRQIKETPRG